MTYWIFSTEIFTHDEKLVQAKQLFPTKEDLKKLVKSSDFVSPLQNFPYPKYISFKFQIDRYRSVPDNFFTGTGFSLYSKQLVTLLQEYGVNCETFTPSLIDENQEPRPDLNYLVFHLLETVQKSENSQEIHKSEENQLNTSKILASLGNKAIVSLPNVYAPVMSDELKKSIEKNGISGFSFIPLEEYLEKRNDDAGEQTE